jgi:steroid delta-isomerase-like uncharacterized protein
MPRIDSVPSLSRRATLARLGGGGLGFALALHRLGAAAQDATPAASPAALPPLVAQWVDAWNAHDPERLAALYTADGVYEEIPTNAVAQGADAIRALVQSELDAYSGIEVQPQAGFQGDNWAVLQGIFAGRYTGQLPGAPAGAGQPFAVPFATVFRLRDDRIQHNTDYFDAYSFLIQIGVLPAPGTATPTS